MKVIGVLSLDNGHLYIGHGVANTWTNIEIREGEEVVVKSRIYPEGAEQPFPISYHKYDVRKE